MVWQPHPRLQNSPFFPVLRYSRNFSYPLTSQEIWYWQIRTRFSFLQVRRRLAGFPKVNKYYFLPGQKFSVTTRTSRQNTSLTKWQIARSIGQKISKIPTVSAIFVTGALAMDNSPDDDDIDIMIVTVPNSLWFTRFFVSLYLKITGLRRNPHLPEHSSPRVKNKLCDNLWIDTRHLRIFTPSLYHAHEILQAKCIFDRQNIRRDLLLSNPWVGECLPIAYKSQVSSLKSQNTKFGIWNLEFVTYLLYPLNLLFLLVQYLYMLPHRKSEQIGPGYALFHPRPVPGYDMI